LRPAWRATVPAGWPGRAQRAGHSGRPGGLVAFPGDQALGVQLVQAGVQRAVGERPERAEQHVQLLAQLVAVHRRSVQQPKHGELQHATPVPAPGIPPYAYGFYVSSRYLYSISRFDISRLTATAYATVLWLATCCSLGRPGVHSLINEVWARLCRGSRRT